MWMRIVALFVVVAAALAGVLWYSQHRPAPDRVSGFVEAYEIRVGSRVGGRIAKVAVVEGQRVKTGETLVELEPFDLKERLAEAQGKLGQSQAQLERLQKGNRPEEIAQAAAHRDQLKAEYDKLKEGPRKQEVAQAQALLDLAAAQLDLAQQNYNHVKPLFDAHNATRDEMDRATNDLRAAQETVNVRKQQLDQLKEGTRQQDVDAAAAQLAEAEQALALMRKGARDEDIAAARAAVEAQQAAVAGLNKAVEELRIAAPCDGVIEAVDIRPGDLLAANAPALSVMDTSELWVRAYVPEDMQGVQPGQNVRVTVDSLRGRDFAGTVSFVARQAEFTPLNVQTPETRSKQVFRIRVTLKDAQGTLRPGMSADVWLSGK